MQMLDRTTQYLNPHNALIHLCLTFNLLYITLIPWFQGKLFSFYPVLQVIKH